MNEPQKPKLSSPQERLELILLCLAKKLPVSGLCREAGVSRELCYRWLRGVRKAALKALEPKVPGPKRVQEDLAPWQVLKLQEQVQFLEKDLRKSRKDRDEWKLRAEMGRRIIQRNAWGTIPKPGRKKNAMRVPKRESSACESGPSSAPEGRVPGPLPGAGPSAGGPTGAGPLGSSKGSEPAE